jgi:hypothetical protein
MRLMELLLSGGSSKQGQNFPDGGRVAGNYLLRQGAFTAVGTGFTVL